MRNGGVGTARARGYVGGPPSRSHQRSCRRSRLFVVLFFAGCIHMRPAIVGVQTADDQARCMKLERRVIALHMTAIISGPTGSGAGAGAGIFDGAARYSLAGAAAALALTGAITGYLSTQTAAKYSKECP